MDKLALSLVLGLTCLGLQAKELEPVGMFSAGQPCFDSMELAQNLATEYGEIGILLGEATVMTQDADLVQGIMILFVNQQEKNWTQVIRYPNKVSCIIATGNNLTLREPQKSKTRHY